MPMLHLLDRLDKHFSPKDGQPQSMKVPHVTIWFWIAKCCCTTVGETISDFFNVLFDPCQCTAKGLGFDALLFFPLFFFVVYWNFKLDYYSLALYWGGITLCSICGTIVTDGLHDNLGLDLWIEILIFFTLMTATFTRWHQSEGTLDVHSINSFRKESYYWATIIWTFALGTAIGDCTADQWGINFAPILGFFIAITLGILLVWAVSRKMGWIVKGDQYDVFLFWSAYIMTRPVGASTGDLLGSSVSNGGWGLGVGYTSLLFFGIIVLIVLALTYSKVDADPNLLVISPKSVDNDLEGQPHVAAIEVRELGSSN
jgi:uncharacterized membrane-anchored protein